MGILQCSQSPSSICGTTTELKGVCTKSDGYLKQYYRIQLSPRTDSDLSTLTPVPDNSIVSLELGKISIKTLGKATVKPPKRDCIGDRMFGPCREVGSISEVSLQIYCMSL